MKNRFVAIPMQGDDEFAFADVETGRRHHLDKAEFDNLMGIMHQHIAITEIERMRDACPVDSIVDAILEHGRNDLDDQAVFALIDAGGKVIKRFIERDI